MNHVITLACSGRSVTPGVTHVQAVSGKHMGSWWRVDGVRTHKGSHTVLASRRTRVGRQRITGAPDMFGLLVEEVVSLVRHAFNVLHAVRVKCDDGIILGALALVPLALFEAFHGGEMTRHLLESLFNSSVNTGGEH